MKNWFENLKVVENNVREAQFLQVAYQNTFCNASHGKQVLCHLDLMIQDIVNDPETHAEAKLMAGNLLETILNNCGIIHDYDRMKALTGTAKVFKTETKVKTESEL